MRYDIHGWEELEELADEPGEADRIVLYVGGRRIRTRVEANEPEESVEESETAP